MTGATGVKHRAANRCPSESAPSVGSSGSGPALANGCGVLPTCGEEGWR